MIFKSEIHLDEQLSHHGSRATLAGLLNRHVSDQVLDRTVGNPALEDVLLRIERHGCPPSAEGRPMMRADAPAPCPHKGHEQARGPHRR